MADTTKAFDSRAFTAILAAISGIGLPLSGIMNHELGFEGLTLSRHVWMSAHNILGLIFMVAVIWHILINRKSFTKHLRRFLVFSRTVGREAFYALAVVAFLLLVFVGHAFHVQ